MAATTMKLTTAYKRWTTVAHTGQASYSTGTTLGKPADRSVKNAHNSCIVYHQFAINSMETVETNM